MDITEHIEAIGREGQLFAAAGRAADMETPIVHCPGWVMRDLLRHLAEIHLWASAHVALRATKMWVDDLSDLSGYWPDLAHFWPVDEELVDHYLATHANLLASLEAAPADLGAMTFLEAPSPLAMWARRQAHEIAVHRFDAQWAAGDVTGFDAKFAADGIDELLCAFAPRSTSLPIDDTQRMAVSADDTGHEWVVTLSPAGIDTTRGGGDADVRLSGTAEDLYLMLWNRGDRGAVAVDGDSRVVDTWRASHRVRWD